MGKIVISCAHPNPLGQLGNSVRPIAEERGRLVRVFLKRSRRADEASALQGGDAFGHRPCNEELPITPSKRAAKINAPLHI
jgi:hypothetical protein